MFDQNISKNYEKFKQNFRIYLMASGLENKTDERKVAIFLNVAGEDAIEVFNTFQLTEAQKTNYNDVVAAFDNYCKPRCNETYDRFKFFSRSQQEGETFDNFIKELKILAKPCNFGDQKDSLIRDRIILGIQNLSLQEKLLSTGNLQLEKAEQLCRAAEASKLQIKGIKGEEVNAIKKFDKKKEATKETKNEQEYDCLKCGRKHRRGECPAHGKKCNRCKKIGHFEVGCRVKKYSCNRNYNKKSVHDINNENDQDDLFIDTLSLNNVSSGSQNCWFVKMCVNCQWFKFKIDTGAECNVLPIKYIVKLDKQNLITECDQRIIAYGNNRINVVGSIILKCTKEDGKTYPIKFVVVDVNNHPILGLNACVKLKLITRLDECNVKVDEQKQKLDFVNKNKDLFEGTGKVAFTYKITLKNNYTPVVSSCRRVPDSIKPRLKTALENLCKKGIIVKENSATEWVNNLVIVEKTNGSLRLCLDPAQLNKCICNESYPIPTLDEIALKLKGKKIFTVIDMKEGFYHIPLDEASSKLCTFITPFGKFRFTRLPFGLSCSPEVFQRVNEEIFKDLNVGIYFDDIIISGVNEEEHDKEMTKFLKRAKLNNVRFNKDKLQYKVKEVNYLGQVITGEGIKPDPTYIEAILALERPGNKKDLLRILGMVNYLIRYVPKSSEVVAPFRNLIKKNVEFLWTPDHDKLLQELKHLMSNLPVLKIFDPKLPITIQCDASQSGLGGYLLQGG